MAHVSDGAVEYRKELDRHAKVDLPQDTSLRFCYGMSKQILSQAQTFQRLNDLDRAYIFYKRFLRLSLDVIPNHVEYLTGQYGQDRQRLIRERPTALHELENITKKIDEQIAESSSLLREKKSNTVGNDSGSADDDLERRYRELGTGISAASCMTTQSTDDDKLIELHDELSSPLEEEGIGLPSPSAPPLDEEEEEEMVLKRSKPMDVETACKSLGLVKEDVDGVEGLRYYPIVSSPVQRKPSPSAALSLPSNDDSYVLDRNRSKHMRPLILARGLIGKFSEIAEPNTRAGRDGLETCGVLIARDDGHSLRFDTLIIPKQDATSDSVTMTHEEELFNHVFNNKGHEDLCVCGWIHTHPRQACFMSSVDVHTQCGFQTMLSEAVAIVVAPTDVNKRVGVFRLTEPDGLELIQECTLRGFHPHPSDFDIYQDHHSVQWDDSSFRIIDLRDK